MNWLPTAEAAERAAAAAPKKRTAMKKKAAKKEGGDDVGGGDDDADADGDEAGAVPPMAVGVPPAGANRFCIVRFSKDVQFAMPNKEMYDTMESLGYCCFSALGKKLGKRAEADPKTIRNAETGEALAGGYLPPSYEELKQRFQGQHWGAGFEDDGEAEDDGKDAAGAGE